MSCKTCRSDIFKQKLGRCPRCMKQLTFLSIGGWLTWLEFFQATPYQIEAIATFMISSAFTGLLALHLLLMGYYRLASKK
ncbi:DUF3624 domain-containing protein [Aliivibrio finisterrensis]|uniref:DUF3624 domain-containing protein n=1 Tax=Aliivibrio finisterrensis TaxID=511998 RepID=A0A4Q5KR65_9GAMM|nr:MULTISPECIES: DUF3624 domain-containing protein [Aliivibrio]MDD9175728.1 DUF3624 domain-containing protein [Aliivibrio sp. S3TY1]MDD9178298.1 DUF3624 domain-containing protein [Aliivibrio sp. A6]MDD9192698.1 DUF3624 domain-containing protein [Aliivibrio sp. S2TY2]RYU44089.1 DUF3624 domain-containing protein [Aliivibrio finisterrensis]RYU49400.1 DUF3624 domain-containing protein [Aliivibrio finisterrensis]